MRSSNNKKAKLLRDAIHTVFLMHGLEDDAEIMLKINLDSYFGDYIKTKLFIESIKPHYDYSMTEEGSKMEMALMSNDDAIVQLVSYQVGISAFEDMHGSSNATDFANPIFAITPSNSEQLKYIKHILPH